MILPQISVVIPAYNEESRLPHYLEQITAYLDNRKVNYEVIIVDDGSSDSTAQVVKTIIERNPRLQLLSFLDNRGKGAAVREGMLHGRGRLRLFADADGATPITELGRLEKAISEGADVAIASRALRDQSTKVLGTVHRKILGMIFNLMVRVFALPGIHDTQCGFKLFTDQAVTLTFPVQTINDYGFDVEILFIARKRGLLISEVPVNWTDIPCSKVRLVRDSIRMLGDLIAIRINNLRSRYRL